ncbi:uncharacterized protein A1O5_05881 [Cladophialophora psammophila CBS 110553]|uniref:Stc1 domain-containing protein n=1 Tax=Cladophialophora psammophila CBS 110553 TaxID=1182543 RepID=W9XKK5_9EURO|nr:uncharacterized protein A1O5_05881 [Cladophialophora psammophila CBS 110553]EXJ70889.1 hypothetical protein A1O5_05881 [Cladophialophora psammophila CBS 110553]
MAALRLPSNWQNRFTNVDVGTMIPCIACNVQCFRARFSQNQLTKYQEALAREMRGGPKAELPRCRNCTPEATAELYCTGCRVTKDLSFFSKQQRKKPDDAKCLNCQQEVEDRVPSLEAALEEERIRDDEIRGKHLSGSVMSSIAGSVISSRSQSQVQSASASGIYIVGDRDSAWGGDEGSIRPPSPTETELSSTRSTSSRANSGYAKSVSKNSFAKSPAYVAPAKARVMNQLEREERQRQEVQMGSRHGDSDDDDGEWEL